jgi:hypothetical protein
MNKTADQLRKEAHNTAIRLGCNFLHMNPSAGLMFETDEELLELLNGCWLDARFFELIAAPNADVVLE